MSLKRKHTENQGETCLKIGIYVELMTSFLDSNYTNDSI